MARSNEEKGESSVAAANNALKAQANGTDGEASNYELPWSVPHAISKPWEEVLIGLQGREVSTNLPR